MVDVMRLVTRAVVTTLLAPRPMLVETEVMTVIWAEGALFDPDGFDGFELLCY
jgi:hypothetical protein